MEALKEILATFSFIFGIIFLYSITFTQFDWYDFFIGITLLALAYFIWPSKKKGQRESSNIILDIIEIAIELPVDLFIGLVRFIGRLFRNKDGGIDLDIDF